MSTSVIAVPDPVRPRWSVLRPAGAVSPDRPPLPIALALAVAGGVLLTLAYPGTGWWPLAPLGVAAISLATRGQRVRLGALIGGVAGLAFFLPHLFWSGVYVGRLPWVALATLEAAFVALQGALLPLAWRAPGGRVATVIATAGLWVGQEALRGREPFGGFPWGRLAFSQADAPTLGYASLGGAPLVGAVVALGGACLAVAIVELSRGRSPATAGRPAGRALVVRVPAVRVPAVRVLGAVATAALGVGVIGGGAFVPRPTGAPATAEVAAVQGNVPAPGLEFNAHRMAVLSNHVLTTAKLADRIATGQAPQPDVVLWPENASDIDPLLNDDAASAIQAATDRVGVPILVGAVLERPVDHLSNAGILWGPTGSAHPGPGARYLKRHPAPFAEYIPYRSFFRIFSDKVDLVRRDFAPGDGVGVLDAGTVRIGDVICFEVAYDGLVRDPVRDGANLLAVQTNNATFGYTAESVQQLAMSRLRAVETGRAVVHISTVGVSALISPDGHVLAGSGHFTQQVLQARLPLRTGQTLATRLGELPEAGMTAVGLLLAAAALLRGRRAPAGVAPTPPIGGRG